MEEDKVKAIVTELEDEMMNITEHETDKYQALEDKYSSLLHPNHYQVHTRYSGNTKTINDFIYSSRF